MKVDGLKQIGLKEFFIFDANGRESEKDPSEKDVYMQLNILDDKKWCVKGNASQSEHMAEQVLKKKNKIKKYKQIIANK